MAKPVMSLQPSEIALFEAASRIYASYVLAGRITDGNENDMIDRSVQEAFHMARLIEEAIQADSELG